MSWHALWRVLRRLVTATAIAVTTLTIDWGLSAGGASALVLLAVLLLSGAVGSGAMLWFSGGGVSRNVGILLSGLWVRAK